MSDISHPEAGTPGLADASEPNAETGLSLENDVIAVRAGFGIGSFSHLRKLLCDCHRHGNGQVCMHLDGVFAQRVGIDAIGLLIWAVEFNQSQGFETRVETDCGSRDRQVLEVIRFCRFGTYQCNECCADCTIKTDDKATPG